MKKEEIANWLNLLLGVWLLVSLGIFSFNLPEATASAVMWNYGLMGIATIGLALAEIRDMKPWEEWVNVLIGIWLFISPWALSYTTSSGFFWNSIVVGILLVAFSGYSIPVAQQRMRQKGTPTT